MTAAVGSLFAGRFRLDQAIGSGGMGSVWRARDEALGRDVAIKLLKVGIADTGRERFEREARVMGELSHPGVLRLFDAGVSEDRVPFLVMELLEGETLSERFQAGPMELDELLGILRAVLHGLAHVHERRIIHRDLKPSNIFLRATGEPLLIDFGLAWSADLTPLTMQGDVLGTPAYMAPELVTDGFRFTPQSDLFAVGCVAIEGLVGWKLHALVSQQVTMHSILTALQSGTFFEAARRALATQGPIAQVVLAALARRPADRPPSATAMLAALNRAAARAGAPRGGTAGALEHSSGVDPATQGEASGRGRPRSPRRRRALTTAIAVAICLIVLAGRLRWHEPSPDAGAASSPRPAPASAPASEARSDNLAVILEEMHWYRLRGESMEPAKSLAGLPDDVRRPKLRVALAALNRQVATLRGLLQRAARYSGPDADRLLALVPEVSVLCDRIDDHMQWVRRQNAEDWLPSALRGLAADTVGTQANPYAALVHTALLPDVQDLLRTPFRLTLETRATGASAAAEQLMKLVQEQRRLPGVNEALALSRLFGRAADSWEHLAIAKPERSRDQERCRREGWRARKTVIELVSPRAEVLDLARGEDHELGLNLFSSAAIFAAEVEAPVADRQSAFRIALAIGRRLRDARLRRVPGVLAIDAGRIEDLRGAALSLRIEFDPSTFTGDEGEPRRNGRGGTDVERLR